jgi:hypothetical protein
MKPTAWPAGETPLPTNVRPSGETLHKFQNVQPGNVTPWADNQAANVCQDPEAPAAVHTTAWDGKDDVGLPSKA